MRRVTWEGGGGGEWGVRGKCEATFSKKTANAAFVGAIAELSRSDRLLVWFGRAVSFLPPLG